MRTVRVAANVTGVVEASGNVNAAPVMAETSRAIPAIDRQSARLGVSFNVSNVSSSASAARTDAPGVDDSGSPNNPDASSAMPNSCAEHNMPRDSMPRTVARLMVIPPGSTAPSSAQGTSIPAAAFGAPQTICSACAAPTSTVHTRRRSAFGCGSTLSIRATTTWSNAGATGSMRSTSSPAMVNLSASADVDSAGSTSVRNHCSENFMGSPWSSRELPQKAQVVLEK